MDDREFAAALVKKFTTRLPDAVREIEWSLAECDWASATAKAHTLKGEAGSLAAVALQAAAGQLEESLRSARHDRFTRSHHIGRLAGVRRDYLRARDARFERSGRDVGLRENHRGASAVLAAGGEPP